MSLDPADFRPVNYVRPGSLQARYAEAPVKISSPVSPLKEKSDPLVPEPKIESGAEAKKEGAGKNTDLPASSSVKQNAFIGLSQYDEKTKIFSPQGGVKFARVPFARDLRLSDGEIFAPARTVVTKYKSQMFPGIVTDSEGRLYLYDRGKKFHRKIKLVEEKVDTGKAYRLGFKTVGSSSNFVQLGRLEDLHALLSASNGGKVIVDLTDNKKDFASAWMSATSSDPVIRQNYLDENAKKILSKPISRALRIGGVTGAVLLAGAAVTGWAVAFAGGAGDLPKSTKPDLSEAEKIALTAGVTAGAATGITAGGVSYAARKYRLKLLAKSANIIQPPSGYRDY